MEIICRPLQQGEYASAAKLEQENKVLKNYIDQLGTVEGIKHIARTELGLVPPDTIFFVPTDSTGK